MGTHGSVKLINTKLEKSKNENFVFLRNCRENDFKNFAILQYFADFGFLGYYIVGNEVKTQKWIS